MVRKRRLRGTWYLACLLALSTASAQEAGPIILEYGKVYRISNPDIPTGTEQYFKAVFDVYDSPGPGNEPNAQLETAARFLNMHAQYGIPAENLHLALVVHGKATEDLLNSKAYTLKFKNKNPNAGLIEALLRAGVEIAVCSQSATARHISREETLPGVQWSLSAMTALIHYQNLGYRLIKF